MWRQNSKHWHSAKSKSNQSWTPKSEIKDLEAKKSLSKLRDILKEKPGTLEDAF
jgi:hypothetical protein